MRARKWRTSGRFHHVPKDRGQAHHRQGPTKGSDPGSDLSRLLWLALAQGVMWEMAFALVTVFQHARLISLTSHDPRLETMPSLLRTDARHLNQLSPLSTSVLISSIEAVYRKIRISRTCIPINLVPGWNKCYARPHACAMHICHSLADACIAFSKKPRYNIWKQAANAHAL